LNSEINKIVAVINSAENIVIAGHIGPDADSIGSSLALAIALFKLGKKPVVLLEDYKPKFEILPGFEHVYKGSEKITSAELFICLDCGDINRIGKYLDLFKKSEENIVIDHHVSNDYFGKYNYVKPGLSSTCEIVYEIIEKLTDMDTDIASCLYAGMLSDTGGFRYKSTSPDTLEIASKLLRHNVPFNTIFEELMYKRSLLEMTAFKYALTNLVIVDDLKLGYTHINLAEREEGGINSTDVEGVSELIMRTREVEISIFAFERKDGMTKISLRSKELDVNKIAQHFGGGGHKNASGCICSEKSDEVIKLIIEKIRSEF